ACNLLVNPMSFNMIGPYEWLKTMLFPVMFVQPSLFAVWAVLGPGPAIWRVPLMIAVAALVAFCGYYNGLRLFADTRSSNWNELKFLYVWAVMFPVVVILLMVFRRLTNWRVDYQTAASPIYSTNNQFSLK